MQEDNLLVKPSRSVISIEGVPSEPSWFRSQGGHKNPDNTYTFDGISSLDYIRIPYGTSPYPTGENMEIRLNARIMSQAAGPALYLLGKWYLQPGDGEITFKRAQNGNLALDIGSISESATQSTSATIPLNQDFEIYWRRLGTNMHVEFNGVQCLSLTQPVQRQINIDWVVGGYLNASNQVDLTAGKGSWKLNSLKINRLVP